MTTAAPTRAHFANIEQATLTHLHDHGCSCSPYSDGSLLATLAVDRPARKHLVLGQKLESR
ncbi:MAG TPA: hypothetical protein VGL88_05100 [Pseudonocardiaceae bacterium]|jgi:hypothetical protein